MEEKIETVEDVKVEGTGEQTNVATDTKAEVKMVSLEEAQKMVNGALAKKLPPKEEMEAFKKWQESQKTESEKQAEALKELETLRQEKLNTQRENALLKKGINEEDIDYIMFKVGKMEGEFDENLVEFLKENPKFTTKEETKVVTTGVKTSGVENKDSGVTAILKQKHPELFND
jgi:hypothetical protein